MSTEEIIAEVKEYMLAGIAAWNEGDMDTFVPMFHPEVTCFYLDGSLLSEGMTKEGMVQWYEAGYKPHIQLRHLEVRVYGDTVVATVYFVGSVTHPGVGTQSGVWRYTAVIVNQDGAWQTVHYHVSPLVAGVQESQE